MATSDETRLSRIDAAIVAIWAGLSLFIRRVLGPFPATGDPQTAAAAILQLTPAKMVWLPLVFYAGILPLAILLFHRTYAVGAPRQLRLGSVAAATGFVLYAIGLSLNIVEATAASGYLAGLPSSEGWTPAERFTALWRADQAIGIALLVLLAVWMAAVSRASQAATFARWPRWFSLGSLAGALITVAAGGWGVITQGALAAIDGGDGLILVHLWIGLAATLVWQQHGSARGAG